MGLLYDSSGAEVSYASRTGAVLFASGLDQVATFYSKVLGLGEANRDDDHILLESPGFQLVVHRLPDLGHGNAACRTTYSSREGGLQTGLLFKASRAFGRW